VATEEIPKGEEVARDRMAGCTRSGTELGWSDPTFAQGSVPKVNRGSLQPNKKILSVRAVRIWAKQVKKVGITHFSFVFTLFFTL
jgi:hypothetical protein